jgi:c-di-AMP phosphodiesterase-like protein
MEKNRPSTVFTGCLTTYIIFSISAAIVSVVFSRFELIIYVGVLLFVWAIIDAIRRPFDSWEIQACWIVVILFCHVL